jgi:hypothetical protein
MDYRCPNCGENLKGRRLRPARKENSFGYDGLLCSTCNAKLKFNPHPLDEFLFILMIGVAFLVFGAVLTGSTVLRFIFGVPAIAIIAWIGYFITRKNYTVWKYYKIAGTENATEQGEYAPEYTRAERIRHVVPWAIVVLAIIAYLWCLLWLLQFVSVHCRTVFGVNGSAVLFYGVFPGIPLVLALLIGIAFGPMGWRGIKARQFPPPGQKVYRRTKIKKGWLAVVQAAALMVLPLLLIGGSWVANQTLANIDMHARRPNGWPECARPVDHFSSRAPTAAAEPSP